MENLKCENCGLETDNIENGLCYICQDDNKDIEVKNEYFKICKFNEKRCYSCTHNYYCLDSKLNWKENCRGGIDYTKDNVFDAIGRPDLKINNDFQKISKMDFNPECEDCVYNKEYIEKNRHPKEEYNWNELEIEWKKEMPWETVGVKSAFEWFKKKII